MGLIDGSDLYVPNARTGDPIPMHDGRLGSDTDSASANLTLDTRSTLKSRAAKGQLLGRRDLVQLGLSTMDRRSDIERFSMRETNNNGSR